MNKVGVLVATVVLAVGPVGIAQGSGPIPKEAPGAGDRVDVGVGGPAGCEGRRCVAASPAGDARCEGDTCIAASLVGNASCRGDRCVAVTATGSARCQGPHFQPLLDDLCFAVSGTGDANRTSGGGGYAFSATGECYDRECYAVNLTDDARGKWLAASLTGPSQGVVAASVLGDSKGVVAVSGTGDASCGYPCLLTMSGTGEGEFSGCETGRWYAGSDAACRDAPDLAAVSLP